MKIQKYFAFIFLFLFVLLILFNHFASDFVQSRFSLAHKFKDSLYVDRINTDASIQHGQTAINMANESSPAVAYCNFPSASDFIDTQEGKPPSTSWILRQVQVVIRHGDRSPMNLNLYQQLGVIPKYCKVLPDVAPYHPLLRGYISMISADHEKMLRGGNSLSVRPFPNSDVCDKAMLSQLGVVQQLQNGFILKKAYVERYNLLNDTSLGLTEKVSVISTMRSRTIQSVIAFLYALIPQYHLDKVKIHYSYSDLFRNTGCRAARRMKHNIDMFQHHIYHTRQRTNTTFRKLSGMFGLGDHSGQLIDSLINGFLCKNIKLPCAHSKCVTVEDLDTLMNEEEFLMRETAQHTSFTNQSMLTIQPLLTKILTKMTKKVTNMESVDLVAYSGHDTTLKPLIRALGIKEFRWPRLGTRLVFELWMDALTKEHYVRVLLNGKNYSSHLHCYNQNTDLAATDSCTFESFQSFVTTEIPHHFDANTIEEACL